MDTKLKNIKYSLGTKVLAVVIMWASLVVSMSSSFYLLLNTQVIRTDSYEETWEYAEELSRLTHNVTELGARFKHGSRVITRADRYDRIKYNLNAAVNFNYYIKDLQTGLISHKITGDYSQEEIKNQPNVIYIDKDEVPYFLYEHSDITNMLQRSPQEIYISLNDPLVPGDAFYQLYNDYQTSKTNIVYVFIALIGSLLLLLISFIYLLISTGRRERGGEVYLADIDRIYNDIQSLFVLFAAGLSIALISGLGLGFGMSGGGLVPILIILSIDAAIGMTYFFSMLRQFKKGQILRNTLIYKIFSSGIDFIKSLFTVKIFNGWMIGIMLIYAFINGLLFSYATGGRGRFVFGSFLIMSLNVAAVYLAFNRLKSLSLIMKGAKEISEGDLEYEIDQSQISMEFAEFAKDIQSIQGGLKTAVNKAIKGERMKTDLITNVSHDLKTPLTSIINYVDLLKQEELNSEAADAYIGILEEKSNRLKQLIEDLIEASKASSGNIAISKEEVDLKELVTQACGEYEEKIQQANLDLRINSPEEKVLIFADGKYMWRIIENIMSNAIKYSMENSRIYIDIEESNGYGLLTMKNMSAYPLDIDPAELTERFIRADQSRSTEGSGLGLSIAQSLTSIQDGHFGISIDGDLFKVTIEVPTK